jgi:hypothetical protein
MLVVTLMGLIVVLAAVVWLGTAPAAARSSANLAARAAAEAPDFQIGGPILQAPDGALVALELTGRRLAVLVPHGASHLFRVVPADRARVEAANPPQLAVATGHFSRPWVRVPLPQGPDGAAFLQLLGARGRTGPVATKVPATRARNDRADDSRRVAPATCGGGPSRSVGEVQ